MTQSFLLFVSLCAVLTILLSWMVIYPWLKQQKIKDNQLMDINIKVFNDRILELEHDKAMGFIDDTAYQSQSVELKRQLLDAQATTYAIAPVGIKSRLIVIVWISILVTLAYTTIKDRSSVFELWKSQDTVGQVADDLLTGKIDVPPEWAAKNSTALISAMQTNVHHHAYDANRWMRLSELFLMLDAKPQALEALARANRLQPDDDQIALTLAQTSFVVQDGKLDQSSRKILQKILEKTPNHEGALMLMAMGEARSGNYPQAKAWIERLRSNIAMSSGDRSEALASLDRLSENIAKQEKAVNEGIRVLVKVSQSLLSQVGTEDVVFVSISEQSGGAPYAVKRLAATDFKNGELQVFLSDLDAMMPDRKLSVARQSQTHLVLNARISRSGSAISQSGDLIANPTVIHQKSKEVTATISHIVP